MYRSRKSKVESRKTNIRRALLFLLIVFSMTLSAQDFSADRDLFDAYQAEDMSVWKHYLDSLASNRLFPDVDALPYEYGYCAAVMAEDKDAARPYVAQFRKNVASLKDKLPAGHYEMYMSAVYVYELRLKESIHPIKAMSLAKDAVQKAPKDPLVLSYYGTCHFYAPKPFGNKKEALEFFKKAEVFFRDSKWQYCWMREANTMYIHLCHEKYHLK